MDADSAVAFPNGDVEFVGHMRYRDTSVVITASRAYYRKVRETWETRGDVVVRDLETGSTIRGPTIDYLRAAAGMRDSAEVYATGRPRVDYFDDDSSTAATKEPYIINADRLRARGKALIWAGGRVQIDRSDLAARGDSLALDTGPRDAGTLVGHPVFRGIGADSFALSGARVDFELEQRQVSYVKAAEKARLVRADWDLTADTIAIDVDDRKVQRMFAWGRTSRAEGKSTRYAVRADSVALDTPGEVLSEIRAFGRAWVAGAVDSASGERDWLAGDSVVAEFVAPPAGDTSGSKLSRLSARREARSFRRSEPARPGARPGLAYVTGGAITILMLPGGGEKVDRVDVVGKVDGVQLDPAEGAAPR